MQRTLLQIGQDAFFRRISKSCATVDRFCPSEVLATLMNPIEFRHEAQGSSQAYRDVDAVQVGRLVSRGVDRLVHMPLHADAEERSWLGLLVEDRVDGDGCLSGLAVADDQLSLTAANRDEAVHSLQASGPANKS